jgi:hypothetical protein
MRDWGRSDDNRLYDSCPAHVMTAEVAEQRIPHQPGPPPEAESSLTPTSSWTRFKETDSRAAPRAAVRHAARVCLRNPGWAGNVTG